MRLGRDRGAWLFVLSSLLVAAAFLVFESREQPWAAERLKNEIRIRLAGQPREVTLTGSQINFAGRRMSPEGTAAPSSLRLRAQSKGLLLLPDSGPPIVLDQDALFISWNGRAELSYERKGHKNFKRAEIGRLLVQKWQEGLRLVLHCELETYLSGVIEAEIGGASPIEALKAQAIASRSYAISCTLRANDRIFDLYDDARSQVYRGIFDGKRVRQAIEATRGQVLRYGKKVLRAYFGSTCGGKTRDGKTYFRDVPGPPFRSVLCTACEKSSRFRWTRRFNKERLKEIEPGAGALYITAGRKSKRGDWIDAKVRRGKKTAHNLAFSKVMRALSLPSTWITAIKTNSLGGIAVTGRGFGHGVGLCQHGARGYAQREQDYRQILSHYYPGSTIDRYQPD